MFFAFAVYPVEGHFGQFGIAVFKNDEEFVAAEPEHDVGFFDVAGYDADGLDDDLVAFAMAEIIVDIFQLVQVDQAYGRGFSLGGALRHGA